MSDLTTPAAPAPPRPVGKRLVYWVKLVMTVAVVACIAYQLYVNVKALRAQTFHIHWRNIALSAAAFAAFMVQSALVWRWLARRMGDRTPAAAAVGAYVYSQMGKYVPGKVALLLMRIARATRAGMDARTCIVATLIENAMYMVSGGVIAAGTLMIFARGRWELIVPLAVGVVAMCVVFHPVVFYALVNRVLHKMKQPEVPPEKRLTVAHLALAVLGFVPCWVLGGVSLWFATRGVVMAVDPPLHPPTAQDLLIFPGTVAFGVVGGMAFLTPGGLGPKEIIMGLFVAPIVGSGWATLAVVIQRLVQIGCEVGLGLVGAILTRHQKTAP